MRGHYAHPDRYDRRSPGLPGDVDFYLTLAREAQPPVLELGCGTGRVTLPIACEGIDVVGLDVEPRMLAVAREHGARLDCVDWVEADMRRFRVPARFGLIFIAYRGFLHLLTVKDQQSALRCALEHLVPGGRLALNIVNPVVLGIIPRPGLVAMSQARSGFKQRYVFHAEMRNLLNEAGFHEEALYGGFDRSAFYEQQSTEMIWVATRARW